MLKNCPRRFPGLWGHLLRAPELNRSQVSIICITLDDLVASFLVLMTEAWEEVPASTRAERLPLLNHLLALWPWASYLASLCLNVLTYKMSTTTVSPDRVVVRHM